MGVRMSIDSVIRNGAVALLAFLAWQIFVNTNRITALEEDLKHHEKLDRINEEAHADLTRRIEQLEQRLTR